MPFWKNKRVLITGHTGFKGSWLSLWLQQLGADICGYALEPPTTPSLFYDAEVARGMRSHIADIRELKILRNTLLEFRPEIVIHMAAQSLVRTSYEDPIGTYAVNVMGTANLLEAVRSCDAVRSVVIITTDKCYENKEWPWAYRETDTLGGYDPYSNSKACAELVTSAWRNSFFNPARYSEHGVGIATVRAGNVIGGGDWAKDRLVPDVMRALISRGALVLRNPNATRPWQHVLEPLRGYLLLAQRLYEKGADYATAFNFGPEYRDVQPVAEVVGRVVELWGEATGWQLEGKPQQHEAQTLKLDWSKAAAILNWKPILPLDESLNLTVAWYRAWADKLEMRSCTYDQITQYSVLINKISGTNSLVGSTEQLSII